MELCRALVCEAENLNAGAVKKGGIESVLAHMITGYKNVWMPDQEEDTKLFNTMLNGDKNMEKLLAELHFSYMSYHEDKSNRSNMLFFTPQGGIEALLIFKAKKLSVANEYLIRRLLGHDEALVQMSYKSEHACDNCCFKCGTQSSWEIAFEQDKKEALAWIEEHTQGIEDSFA